MSGNQYTPDALRRQFVEFIVTADQEDLSRVRQPPAPHRADPRGERGPGTEFRWNVGNNKPNTQ